MYTNPPCRAAGLTKSSINFNSHEFSTPVFHRKIRRRALFKTKIIIHLESVRDFPFLLLARLLV